MSRRNFDFRTFRAERMGLVAGVLALVALAFYLTD